MSRGDFGKIFYYVKNLQGDIVKILDEDGQEKANYVYNAWGNILSQSNDELSSINPLRYRGYVYDEDTAMYYLQTRYYDPTTGRFINADDTAYIGATGTVLSANIFTYCENNPIIKKDINGKVTGVDDVFMLAVLIATVAAIAVVIGLIAFKDSWQILCKYMANSLSSLWQDIWNGFVNFYDWSAKKIKLAIKTCKKYISLYRADSRLRSKLKSKRKNSKRFFTVRMEKNKAPIVGPPIDANVAVSKLRRGFDVITYFRTDALNIANRANGKKSECHQKHDHSFYFSHFHVSLKYIKHHIHSFYVVGG